MNNSFSLRNSKLADIFKPAIFSICRLIAGFRLKIKKFSPAKNKTVLLVGTSEVTVDYLLDINEIIKDLADEKTFMLVSRASQEFARTKLSHCEEKITLIPLTQALCIPWDIIIFSDHNNTIWFHPDIPKIRCVHGLYSGKNFGRPGGSYVYGLNALDRKGNLVYDLMFIEGAYIRDVLSHKNPVLKGRMAVVGNLMADNLMALNQKREMIRQDLSIQKEDQVLVIFSTWGPDSLIQRFGTLLLDDILKVSKTYKVYLLIHPLNDRSEFPDKDTIFEFLEHHHECTVKRVDPFVSPLPYLVAADIVLTDHTSLFLYYALLKKPYLFVPLLAEYIEPETLTLNFYELQERYDPNLPLGNQLDCAIKNFPTKQHEKVAKLIIDEPGYARQRIHDEIAKFL